MIFVILCAIIGYCNYLYDWYHLIIQNIW